MEGAILCPGAPETWGVPVVSRGLLYVNQNAMGSRLVCYDLRG